MDDIYYRYFMYSTEHMSILSTMSKNQGKNLKLGQVIINGVPKKYTAIVATKSKYKYTDSRVIAEGDIRKIKYSSSEDE